MKSNMTATLSKFIPTYHTDLHKRFARDPPSSFMPDLEQAVISVHMLIYVPITVI